MNKRQILSSLNNIANSLDNSGLYEEANALSSVMTKVAQQVPQTQQPNQIPQTGQQVSQQLTQQPQQQAYGQQNQSNYANYKPIYDQCHNLLMQIYDNFKKMNPIFYEILRKYDAGVQLQQSQNGFNAILMLNNILHNTKTLHAQYQNLVSQLQKLANPNNQFDQSTVDHYRQYVNKTQSSIYTWSELVNRYNSMIKQRYQPTQAQQPAQQLAQQPVKPQ